MLHRLGAAAALAIPLMLPAELDARPGGTAGPDGAGPEGRTSASETRAEIVKDSYIVLFAPSVSRPGALAERLAQREAFGLRHVYENAVSGMAITVPEHAALRVLEALRRNPNIQAIGNDMRGAATAQTLPKGIDRVNAEPGLPPNPGDGIRVGVLDTGLDFDHPDFGSAVDTSISVDCVNVSGCGSGGEDDNGHGTTVAGVLGARDNTRDVVGSAPASSLFSVKVLGADATGTASDFIAGLDHVAALNASGIQVDVINVSLAFTCSVCTDDSTNTTAQAIHDAIRAVVNGGTTVVVAAGNDGQDAKTTLPAAYDEVITVSALDDDDGASGGDSFAWFSNFGEDIDVIAPGVKETSLRLGGGTRTSSGTSFSSPNAAGAAAVFIRDHLAKTGERPLPGTVRRALIETGECASGMFHDGLGCETAWSGDPDGIGEPLVRADNLASFSDAVSDVAVTGLDVASPVILGETHSVSVGVANEGGVSETFTVSVTESGTEIAPSQDVTLAAGASTSLSFDWTPASTGEHTLTATAGPVIGEDDTSDNSRSVTVTVQEADTHDVAVSALSAPGEASIGAIVDLAVDVTNKGTADESVAVSVTATGPDGRSAGTMSPAQDVTVTAGSTVTLAFSWDTTGSDSGDHTLEAVAELISATDGDSANDARRATVSLTAPATASDAVYVWDMALDVRRRGKGGSATDLLGTVSVRWDSDGDGTAESGDQAAKDTAVDILVIQDRNGDGAFDCADDRCWRLGETANGQGEAAFALKGVPAGAYRVAVTGLSAAGLSYDPGLDRGNPSHITIR